MFRLPLACIGVFLAAALTGCVFSIDTPGSQPDRRTPLEKAAQGGDVAEVRRLLASGADPNDKSDVFGSPIAAASLRQGNVEIVRLLIRAGADPNGRAPEPNQCWVSPLNYAALHGDVEMATALMEAGAEPIQRSLCSHWSAGSFQPKILDLLVPRGLDIMRVDAEGRNELHLALSPSYMPRPETIGYLIRAGVPINARDKRGRTPLSYWKEPRDFEVHWIRDWIFEKLGGYSAGSQGRKTREEITSLLKQSGAVD